MTIAERDMESRVGASRATSPECGLGCPAKQLTTFTGRAEPSATERTVQKISRVILRGSKKARETSLTAQDSSGGGGGKDKKAHGQEKKSAQEKREMFKTQHKDS